jgi:hypothetical protein
VLAYADLPPPAPFAERGGEDDEWFGAVRLRLAKDEGVAPVTAPGDAAAFFGLLAAGHRALSLQMTQ